MKVNTLTFHAARNYGAVLQCYALQETLRDFCEEVKVIDYSTEAMRHNNKRYKKNGIKTLAKKILMLRYSRVFKRKRAKFDAFVDKNVHLTKHYDSVDQLRVDPPDSDIVIVGSDQVFNPNRCREEREAFYLDFPCSFKTSYAASFGSSDIPQETKDEIAGYLSSFDALSFREEYGLDICKALTGRKDACLVCDPVFLVPKEKWYAIEEEYKGLPQKYILMFNLRESKTTFELARSAKQKTGLPVVLITGKPNVPAWCDHVLRDVGPGNFLWLIHHSAFFFEDSFHGTAFSLIYHKQFIFCDDHPKSYERGRTLLQRLGLPEAYEKQSLEKMLSENYDYNNVDNRIAALKETSVGYIEKIINEAKRKNKKG